MLVKIKQAVFPCKQWFCFSLSNVFSRQKEEWPVLLGIGCLEFIAEPEPPLLLKLQPAHRLPEGASICTDDTQSRPYRGAEVAELLRTLPHWFRLHSFYMPDLVPLRKENFLRNPEVTKESAKESRRPLKSSPVVLMLMEWGLELTKHTVTCKQTASYYQDYKLRYKWRMKICVCVCVKPLVPG